MAGAAAGDGGDGDGRRGVEWRAAAAADGIERAGGPERYVLKSIHKHCCLTLTQFSQGLVTVRVIGVLCLVFF